MMLTKVLSCVALLSGQSVYAFAPSGITAATAKTTTTARSALYSTTKSNDENGVDGRRAFLSTSAVGCLACLFKPTLVNADGDVDYKAVAADIADIIKKDPDKGPTLVRLVSIISLICLTLYIDIDSRNLILCL